MDLLSVSEQQRLCANAGCRVWRGTQVWLFVVELTRMSAKYAPNAAVRHSDFRHSCIKRNSQGSKQAQRAIQAARPTLPEGTLASFDTTIRAPVLKRQMRQAARFHP